MSELLKLLQQVRDLHINPWAVAIGAGLGAAWLEQKLARGRTAPFTADHQGVAANAPRPHAPKTRRFWSRDA